LRTGLPAAAASAAQARRFARSALAQWGLSALDDTVGLLVTELVSNGVRHAGTTLELILSFDGGCLRIAVSDGDPRLPMTTMRPGLTVGGWGLALIDSLSTEWGTDVDGDSGKTVWFEIDTTTIGTSAATSDANSPE
jgi:anti-sigma regulatory factor (Ser/Thr protein kinase)